MGQKRKCLVFSEVILVSKLISYFVVNYQKIRVNYVSPYDTNIRGISVVK